MFGPRPSRAPLDVQLLVAVLAVPLLRGLRPFGKPEDGSALIPLVVVILACSAALDGGAGGGHRGGAVALEGLGYGFLESIDGERATPPARTSAAFVIT